MANRRRLLSASFRQARADADPLIGFLPSPACRFPQGFTIRTASGSNRELPLTLIVRRAIVGEPAGRAGTMACAQLARAVRQGPHPRAFDIGWEQLWDL